jgi:hypothetical protein
VEARPALPLPLLEGEAMATLQSTFCSHRTGTGPIRRPITHTPVLSGGRSGVQGTCVFDTGCRGARLLVKLILNDRVQPSFIAGVPRPVRDTLMHIYHTGPAESTLG